MYPSGYKEDKIYSLKPTDGSGDLTFTRASTATRVNADGLIEGVRTNLLTYSEQFDNAAWSKSNAIVTANSSISPDGTQNADTLTSSSAANAQILQIKSTTALAVYSASIYVKKDNNESRFPEFYLRTEAVSYNEIYLQINTKTGASVIRFENGTVSQSVESSGDYWRVKLTLTNTADTSIIFGIRPAATNVFGTFAPQVGSVIIWGAQLEQSASATEYIPTTTAAVSVGMLADVPRIDYTGGGCGKLLLEGQSTNLLTYSEQFTDSSWEKISSPTVTPYAGISPDGSNNATLINRNLGGSVNKLISVTSGQSYAFSTFVKKSTLGNAVALVLVGDAFSSNVCVLVYNFDTQIASITAGTATAKAEQYGNGWARITIVAAPSSTNTGIFRIVPSDDNQNSFIWGAQLEASSFPTSYISTLASSVTRLADSAIKTGISSLIGGTSGTVFFDIKTNPTLSSANYKQFCYYVTSGGSQSYLYLDGANKITTNANWGSLFYNTAFQPNTRYKVALVFAPNDFALYINGVSVATASSGTPNNNVDLQIGQFNGSEMCEFVFNQYTHFPTRLTNSELATLTTL